MNGERFKKKALPQEVRVPDVRGDDAWEDFTHKERDAEMILSNLRARCRFHGIEIKDGAKFLEIGSGKGKFVEYMQQQGMDIVGVDARPRGEQKTGVVAARIEQLPFPDNSFDVATSYGVFDRGEYIIDTKRMMSEIARVLKSGGVFYSQLFLPRGDFPGLKTIIDEGGTALYQKE
jgi:ubiquinone/menaquinone biosynthesis C-methylase UbiE